MIAIGRRVGGQPAVSMIDRESIGEVEKSKCLPFVIRSRSAHANPATIPKQMVLLYAPGGYQLGPDLYGKADVEKRITVAMSRFPSLHPEPSPAVTVRREADPTPDFILDSR